MARETHRLRDARYGVSPSATPSAYGASADRGIVSTPVPWWFCTITTANLPIRTGPTRPRNAKNRPLPLSESALHVEILSAEPGIPGIPEKLSLYRFSALWLRSKCSICSYQLNIWYVQHCWTSILIWFLDIGGVPGVYSIPAAGWPGIAVPSGSAHPKRFQIKLIRTDETLCLSFKTTPDITEELWFLRAIYNTVS